MQVGVVTVLIVVGVPCAGKTTIGLHLSAWRGFVHVESSAVLPLAAAQRGIDCPSKADTAAHLFSVAGHGAVEEYAIRCGYLPDRTPVVYTGVRTVEGVAALASHAHVTRRRAFVVHVDVGIHRAIGRSIRRARDAHASAPAYRQLLRRDFQFGALPYARVMADWRIRNAGPLEDLLRRTDAMLTAFDRGDVRRDNRLRNALISAGPPAREPGGAPKDVRWLATYHPTLVDGTALSSRGMALYRILHRPPPGGLPAAHNWRIAAAP
jgi:hypothetical protein